MNGIIRKIKVALWLGSSLCFAATAWCLLAPFLAASKVITVRSELESYGTALVLALIGTGLIWLFRNAIASKPARLVVYMVAAVSLLLPPTLRFFMVSNVAFLHFTAERMSANDWNQVATALKSLDEGASDSFSVAIEKENLPPILEQAVGLKSDFVGGFMLKRDGADSPLEVHLMYGPKSRRWGLVLGNASLVPQHLNLRRTVSVVSELTLYVGVD